MRNLWFISDTHLYHDNILKFTGNDGRLIRPGFRDTEHMNDVIRHNWNNSVKPGDHVYHLGDVSMKMGAKAEHVDKFLGSLNGAKRLVVGNHDDLRHPVLLKHFQKIMLWRIFKEFNFFCCHIPQRKDVFRKTAFQVHGHIHQNLMEDPAYINVCVEHTNYTPIHLDEILQRIKTIENTHPRP